jgi:pyocin large subunit-like protein
MPEFGNFQEYRTAAGVFMGGGVPDGAIEGVRPGGDTVRLDPKTGYFGTRSATGEIRTFFRPKDATGDPANPVAWMQYFLDQF